MIRQAGDNLSPTAQRPLQQRRARGCGIVASKRLWAK